MSTRRLNDRHAALRNMSAQISGGSGAVFQVVLIERLLQANRNGFQVASGQAAIGGVAFSQDQQVFFLLRQHIIVGAEKAANVGHAILFGGHGAAIAKREHLPRNLLGSLVLVAGFAQLNEVGIFSKATGIEIKRDAMLAAYRAYRASIGH